MADFDPFRDGGAVALDDAPADSAQFDPFKVGAIPVEEDSTAFDPFAAGAIPLDGQPSAELIAATTPEGETIGGVPPEEPEQTLGDIVRRVPAAIASSSLSALAGLAKPLADVQQSALAITAPTSFLLNKLRGGSAAAEARQFLSDASARAPDEYGVDPAQNETLPSQLISGAASLVPAIASGPAAPVTMAGMMGEQGRAEAEEAGASESTQNVSFYGNAAVGLLSEALMGVPALLRSAQAAKIPAKTLASFAKVVAAQTAKSAAREGIQEGLEQIGGNFIANTVAGYDPARGTFDGFLKAVALGAAIGAPLGSVIQSSASYDSTKIAEEIVSNASTEALTETANDPAAWKTLPFDKSYVDAELAKRQKAPLATPPPLPVTPEQQHAADAATILESIASTPEAAELAPASAAAAMEAAKVIRAQPAPEVQTDEQTAPEGEPAAEAVAPAEAGAVDAPVAAATPEAATNELTDEPARPASVIQQSIETQSGEAMPAASTEQIPPPQTESEPVQPDISEGSATPSAEVTSTAPDGATPQLDDAPAEPDGYTGGPGAMAPVEAGEMDQAASERATSTKNAVTEAERAVRGEQAILPEARQSNAETLDRAEAAIEANPNRGQEVVARLRSGESVRNISVDDEAVLLVEKVRLRNEREMQAARAADESASPEERAIARVEWEALETKINDLDQATFASGAEWGRLGQFRQRLLRDDFTFEAMERKARASKGGALTAEESATIKAQSERIAELQQQLAELQSANDEKASADALTTAVDSITKEAQGEPASVEPHVASLAERIVASLESAADAARKRIRARLGQANAGVDPIVLADVAIIGAAKLGRGALKFSRWSKAMIEDLGDWVNPHLSEIWEAANRKLDEVVEKASGKNSEQAKRAVRKTDSADGIERAVEGMKARMAEGDDISQLSGYIRALAKHFVKSGIKERDPLLDAVHGVVAEIAPDLTRRQTMDAISGYGQFHPLNTEPVAVTLRDLSGQMQAIGKLEDMEAGRPPAKTGVERRTPSDEERRLQKLVNERKKLAGFTVTDPATQLKSAMDAIKTRLRNEIADIDLAIATKEPIPSKSGSPAYDAEAAALRDRRDEKKAQYDELFPKAPLTEGQQLLHANRAVERAISQLEADLKDGRLYPTASSRRLTSPELAAKRARLESLRAERDHLRALDTATVEARKQKAISDSISRLKERIAQDEIESKAGTPTADTEAVAKLKSERDELNRVLAEKRKAANPPKSEEVRRVEALDKRIAELEAKIAAGDTSTKTAKPTAPTREVAERKALLEGLNKQLAEMRAGPKKTPEQLALQAYKTRTLSRIAEIQEKIARGDFDPKAKRELTLDKAALDLKFKIEQVKEEYLRARFQDQQAKRTTKRKVFDAFMEIISTSRAIKTSFDLSAVLRQGGFITLGHPVRAAKSIVPMLKAFASEKGAFAVNDEISRRDNAPLYQSSGLFLSDQGSLSMTRMEEDFMGRWAAKIPGIASSGRAYSTFLNKLRADSFDAMAETLGRGGKVTPDEAKAVSNFINVATGRGSIPERAAQAAAGLNRIFFAPRYVISRFQLLAVQPFYGGNARTRALVAKEYARYLAGVGVVYALAAAATDDDDPPIDLDPTSSDFLKIRFGNTRLDPMSGILQATVFTAREADAIRSFFTQDEGKKPKYGSGGDVLVRFLRSKLNPAVGSVFNVIDRKDVVGRPATVASEAVGLVAPLSMGDVLKTMEEQGVARGLALSLLSLLGAGVQTYERR